MMSKESGPRGYGFEFTPEGWCSIPLEYWNDGKMETGNPLAGLSGAKRARMILGAKHRTILISSRELTALTEKNDKIQPTPLFQYSTIPSFQSHGYWRGRSAGGGLPWPKDQIFDLYKNGLTVV